MIKKMTKSIVYLVLSLIFIACSESEDKNNVTVINVDNKATITIGTTVGDFGNMVKEFIQPEMAKNGYTIKLIEFTDYVQPNHALADGSIDLNIFQHKPYLDSFKVANNLDLIEVFQVPTGPLALYSGKLKNFDEMEGLDREILISLPNDPSNFARSILMLNEMGWLKLKADIDPLVASKRDIESYIKNINLVELEAAQLPRSRDDIDFAIIPGNYAASSGIKFSEGLYKEVGFTFINWAVVKSKERDREWVKAITEMYQSDGFKEYAKKRFEGYKYPESWN